MKPLLTAAVLGVAAMLSGCGPDTSKILALTGDASKGATLYAGNCERCHGPSALQPSRVAKANPDRAASQILTGEGVEMPSFSSTLSNQDIADLLAYLKSL